MDPYAEFNRSITPTYGKTKKVLTNAAHKALDEKRQLEKLAVIQQSRSRKRCWEKHNVVEEVERMETWLKNMTLDDGDALLHALENTPWLEGADNDLKYHVLSLVDDYIEALKEKNGLPALDDPIPWMDPPNVFQKAQVILRNR